MLLEAGKRLGFATTIVRPKLHCYEAGWAGGLPEEAFAELQYEGVRLIPGVRTHPSFCWSFRVCFLLSLLLVLCFCLHRRRVHAVLAPFFLLFRADARGWVPGRTSLTARPRTRQPLKLSSRASRSRWPRTGVSISSRWIYPVLLPFRNGLPCASTPNPNELAPAPSVQLDPGTRFLVLDVAERGELCAACIRAV